MDEVFLFGEEALKVGFVLLDLHHEVVQVDELRADGQAAERGLVQDLVEAVVVLDQLSKSALRGKMKSEMSNFRRFSQIKQFNSVFMLAFIYNNTIYSLGSSQIFCFFCNQTCNSSLERRPRVTVGENPAPPITRLMPSLQ